MTLGHTLELAAVEVAIAKKVRLGLFDAQYDRLPRTTAVDPPLPVRHWISEVPLELHVGCGLYSSRYVPAFSKS